MDGPSKPGDRLPCFPLHSDGVTCHCIFFTRLVLYSSHIGQNSVASAESTQLAPAKEGFMGSQSCGAQEFQNSGLKHCKQALAPLYLSAQLPSTLLLLSAELCPGFYSPCLVTPEEIPSRTPATHTVSIKLGDLVPLD